MNPINRKSTLKFTFDRNFARPKSSDDIIGYHLSIVDNFMYL